MADRFPYHHLRTYAHFLSSNRYLPRFDYEKSKKYAPVVRETPRVTRLDLFRLR